MSQQRRWIVGGVLAIATALMVPWQTPVQSVTPETRIASACREDQVTVQVFLEGHAWVYRRTWLVLENLSSQPATVYYGSRRFVYQSMMTAIEPWGRRELPVSDFVPPPDQAFAVEVWSSTGAVVAGLTSWDVTDPTHLTTPLSSPMTLVCRGDVP